MFYAQSTSRVTSGELSKKTSCFTPSQPVRLHQANYQRKLHVLRPVGLHQANYQRRLDVFTPSQPVRLHQANYQRRLHVLRPVGLHQANYQRRFDVLHPVNQYGYIRRTVKEDLMFYTQSTSTVTSGELSEKT